MINWKEHDQFIRKSINSLTVDQMANEIGCTVSELHSYMHRKMIFRLATVKRNLALEVIQIRFIHPQYFRPTRQFFEAVGMSQKRWWKVFKGNAPLSEEEYKKLVIHLQIDLKDALEAMQLKISDTDN